MSRLLFCLVTAGALACCGRSRAEDAPIEGVLIEKLVLPGLKTKVAELDKSAPSEVSYGLQGKSVGRNGLREEVPNKDVIVGGKKVNETRFDFSKSGGYGWAEKGGTFGPAGFQYYISRDPLALDFDPKSMTFTLKTKLYFKIAVAVNFDTGFLGIKPWVFADSGFGGNWPNEVDIAITSKVAVDKDGKLKTATATDVRPVKPIVLQTLHGAVKKDFSADVTRLLKGEMDKLAAQLDAEVAKAQVKRPK